MFDYFIITLIVLNLGMFVIGTVESIYGEHQVFFDWFEYISLGVFSIEYLLRLATCGTDRKYTGLAGILRYAATPLMLIDLAAILPGLLPMLGFDLRILRAFRIIRLFRVLKLARYSETIQMLGRVLRNKHEELVTSFGLTFLLILLASTVMYYAERSAQPDTFGSIPSTMWWAVATLTTVGYGDVYPVTVIGKVCGAIVALLGITLFAIPAGILAAAFQEENTRHKIERE